MRLREGRVKRNEKKGNFYWMEVEIPEIPSLAGPGQFVMVRGWEGYELFLPRPLSIAWSSSTCLFFLIRVKGRGTELLSRMKPGEKIWITGPLGRRIELPEKFILVGGGIGIAPLLFLSRWGKGYAFVGGKNKDEIFGTELLEKNGFEVFLATEDGSLGYKGTVVDLFFKKLPERLPVYACGPRPMLEKLQGYDGEIYGFLEERMGCGMGICKGCAIRTKGGIKHLCTDGPVFNLKEVVFD